LADETILYFDSLSNAFDEDFIHIPAMEGDQIQPLYLVIQVIAKE
jgi:hypothetical protein